MPDELILPILAGDGGLSDEAAERVFAIMLYPNDAARREQYAAKCRTGKLVADNAAIPPETAGPTIWGPGAKEFQKDIMDAFNRDGRLVGQLLLLLRQMETHNPTGVSIRKAIYLIHEMHRAYKYGRKANPSAGKDTVRKAWGKYKSVCHLWASLRIFDDSYILVNERMSEFLAAAEWMREFAESRPRMVKPGQLWRVPKQMHIERVEFEVPPLHENELRILSKYSPDK